MRSSLILVLSAGVALGCKDDAPPPEPPMPTFDVPRVDTPVAETGSTDARSLDVDTDRGLTSCISGAFRPCECEPGVSGLDYCVNRMFQGMCRCGDAGPPTFDAPSDADDAGALDAAADATPSIG